MEDFKGMCWLKILKTFDERGSECPAVHNVWHEHLSKPVLEDFYRELDPTNTFNPGIGSTSKHKTGSRVDFIF